MKNTIGDLVRLLLFVIAISFMKLMYVPSDISSVSQSQPETKQVGRGADTTVDKKLVFTKKVASLLSDI